MIRGVTAQFKFKLPYTKSELAWATIKFSQDRNHNFVPITKRLPHCDAPDDSQELFVSLTPEETARFSDKYKAEVQLRAKCATNGTIFGCRQRVISVYPMRDDIIEDDTDMPAANDEGWIILDGKTILNE